MRADGNLVPNILILKDEKDIDLGILVKAIGAKQLEKEDNHLGNVQSFERARYSIIQPYELYVLNFIDQKYFKPKKPK